MRKEKTGSYWEKEMKDFWEEKGRNERDRRDRRRGEMF